MINNPYQVTIYFPSADSFIAWRYDSNKGNNSLSCIFCTIDVSDKMKIIPNFVSLRQGTEQFSLVTQNKSAHSIIG